MPSDFEELNHSVRRANLIRTPSMNIATFGETRYLYRHLAKISDSQTKVREGSIEVKKPLIITRDALKSLVIGFDSKTTDFAEKVFERYRPDLKMLGYQFHHFFREAWIERDGLQNTIYALQKDLENNPMSAIIMGEDKHWEVGLLKICAKVIEKSFRINLSELEEKGLFDKHGVPPKIYEEIEELFRQIEEESPQRINELGDLLVRHQLFEEYEPRFFALMKKIKK